MAIDQQFTIYCLIYASFICPLLFPFMGWTLRKADEGLVFDAEQFTAQYESQSDGAVERVPYGRLVIIIMASAVFFVLLALVNHRY